MIINSTNRFVAILGDTHLGCRNFNTAILDFQVKFFRDLFFPMMGERGIKEVWQTGDLFDNRKVINATNFSVVTSEILAKFPEVFDESVFLVGNHDTPYKTRVDDNWVSQIVRNLKWAEATVVDEPLVTPRATFVPWICKDNAEDCYSAIKEGGLTVVGHFEMNDFLMQRGVIAKSGLDETLFASWKQVLSGHYHERSEKGNVLYVGVPYEMSWGEAHDIKGFHIYDTHEAKVVEFIPNPFKLFHEFKFSGVETGAEVDKELITNGFVKIVREQGTDELAFDRYVEAVTGGIALSGLKIDRQTELLVDLTRVETTEPDVALTTKDLFIEYCNNVMTDTSIDVEAMQSLVLELYAEAATVGDDE